MNEQTFFSKNYAVRCPIWVIVNLDRFEKGEGSNAVAMIWGKPGLGPFLPLFLSMKAADELAVEAGLVGFGALEMATPADLCKVLSKVGADNVAVYLEKDKTRFYRATDLVEELRSHLTN
jgi:hypothetical protein